jgi:Bacterial SH3 domain
MHLLRSLALLAVAAPLAFALARPLAAQQGRAARDEAVRAVPDGNVIATVVAGTTWRTGSARGGSSLVTLEGWIDASRIGGRRDSFPATIGGSGTLRLRAEPSLNARILAIFEAGAGIRVLERRGDWARVRRDGWVRSSALTSAGAAPNPTPATSAPPTRSAPPTDTEPADQPRDGALRASRTVPLSIAPGARAIGTLDTGTVVDPVARDRGWVRVRLEAWVPESLFVPADPNYSAALTAADLRMDPDGMRGRTVRWVVQVVGLQTADPLRRALQPDEPYLLAMGPSGENAILYVAVPPNLLEEARRIAPLTEVTITARVRNGRSQPTGAPVLDLLTLITP